MVVTLGRQHHVGEKPTVILYTYINRHAGTPECYDNVIVFPLSVVPSNPYPITPRVFSLPRFSNFMLQFALQ